MLLQIVKHPDFYLKVQQKLDDPIISSWAKKLEFLEKDGWASSLQVAQASIRDYGQQAGKQIATLVSFAKCDLTR